MTQARCILQKDERGVATLTLNNPQIHNAFDGELINELGVHLQRLEDDPQVRIVVLAAVGDSFCAGADLRWMQQMVDFSLEENRADAMTLSLLMQCLNNLSKPTIALVQG